MKNHKVSRLAAIQEQFMIMRAIKNGVDEERIAKTLNVDVSHIKQKRLSAIHVESCVWGWLKRSRMRSRKWRKLVIPKACHKTVRKPRLKPSVGPLLDRFVK